MLFADHDLYIMQCKGFGPQPGLVFVLNNRGDGWSGTSVQTQWANKQFTPIAWDGYDQSEPESKWTDGSGRSDFWAAPRGFCVYVLGG